VAVHECIDIFSMKAWCILSVNGNERYNLEQIQCRTVYVIEVKSFVGVLYLIHSYGICNHADNAWSFSTLFYYALWLAVTVFESLFNHKLSAVYYSFPPCRMAPFLGWNFFSCSSAHLREFCGKVGFFVCVTAIPITSQQNFLLSFDFLVGLPQ